MYWFYEDLHLDSNQFGEAERMQPFRSYKKNRLITFI